ncbi:unnamed protein product [Gongylonema pulchrum]|uniref:LsmAD domain-containing protein n=1 Tax=Gongylonema pulchrum TaxID=637853 RepID=A0A183DKP6_9BILA|nr:unnamed protein product [Gongylonema pulchrum]
MCSPCRTKVIFFKVPTSGTVPESSRVRISGDAKRREVHNGFGAGWNSVADYESETRKLAAVAMADEIFLDQSRSIFKPRDQHFNGLVDVPNGCSPGHFPVNFKTGGPSCTETFAMANGYQNQPTFKRRDPFIAGAAVKQAEIHVDQNSMKQQDSRAIPAVATPTKIFPDQNSVNFAAGSFPNNAAFAVQGGNFPNQNPLVFMPGAHCATAAMEDGNYMDRNVINCKRTDSHIAAGTFTQNGSMDQNPVTVGTKDFQTPAASLMQDGNFQHQNPVTFKTRDPLISATNVLPGGNHVDWTATDIRATGQGKVAPAAKVKDNGSINTWKDLEDELDMIAMVDAILEEAKRCVCS